FARLRALPPRRRGVLAIRRRRLARRVRGLRRPSMTTSAPALLPRAIDVPTELRGKRVLLRPYARSDARAVLEAIDESRADLEKFGSATWPDTRRTHEQALDLCAHALALFVERTELMLTIVDRETADFLGGCGLHRIDWTARK